MRWAVVGSSVALLGGLLQQAQAQPVRVDSAYHAYTKMSGVSGKLDSVGSDTLNNLMALWSEAFRRIYPHVLIQVEGKGSSTAPPALIQGVAQLGPMSREMKSSEKEAFERKHGYPPTRVPVALDTITVYVHRDNPVPGLSLPQVDAIFSHTRKGGHPKAIQHWSEVGVQGALGSLRISLYGRNSASGTYGFFKSQALFKGDYRNEVKEQPGSSAVVSGLARDIAGVGYSGIGYRTSDVRMVPLATSPGGRYYAPTPQAAVSGDYPLARLLYVYVNKAPGKPLSPLVREFLRLVFSREGQEIVVKDGYFPLPYRIAEQQLALLK